MGWLSSADVKEELSIAYLHAVAADKGLYVEVLRKDRDSVDAVVHGRGRLSPASVLRSPKLGIQLKARSGLDLAGHDFPCELPLRNYDDLRDPAHHVPNILVVLALPAEERDRLEWSREELRLRRCAFWRSLLGEPAQTRDSSVAKPTVTVRVPTRNGLSPETLFELMVRVSCQERLDDTA